MKRYKSARQYDELLIQLISLKRFIKIKKSDYEKVKGNNLFENLLESKDFLRGKISAYDEILEKIELIPIEQKIKKRGEMFD